MTASKIVAAAASGVGGAGLDVDEVFSTFLYDGTGTGSNLTVTNNIDLSTEGGLVWVKNRDATAAHALFDTVRGQNILESQSSGAQDAFSAYGGSASASYNTNGFGINGTGASNLNQSGVDYVSWTFRKAPKFMDIVTYTGTGSTQNISHNLGVVPAMMMVKSLGSNSRWNVYHKDASPNGTPQNGRMALNTVDPWGEYPTVGVFSGLWNNTAPTDSVFTVGSYSDTNASGYNFVAYLFAHNNNDGEFGPDSDQDIIKCGSYTGNNSTTGPVVNVGFEPQWLMIKSADGSENWQIFDSMRGMPVGGRPISLYPNLSNAEDAFTEHFDITPTGFQLKSQSNRTNASGSNYIYMAIRRGPLAVPDDATKVFAIDYANGSDVPAFQSGFPVDMGLFKQTTGTGTFRISSRLTQGKYLETSETNAEQANTNYVYDYQNGFFAYAYSSAYLGWMWKRAPSYFDVVAYQGSGSMGLTLNHNLGAVPEMIWVKNRSANNDDWFVYHSALGNTKWLELNTTAAEQTHQAAWNNTSPTATQFTVGAYNGVNGSSGYHYIAYLFATVAGVSKVGSYTGNATSDRVIDCGFSNGARFVLIKDTSQTGPNWQVFDTARGITSTKAELLRLNLTNAQIPNGSPTQDYHNLIEPDSSGFKLNHTAALQVNASGINYIFYAIA